MKSDNMKNKVSIIIINYNSSEDTIECLNSIKNIMNEIYNIILLDNNSHDDSVEKITQYLSNLNIPSKTLYLNEKIKIDKESKIYFLVNSVNEGFAGGNNRCFQFLLSNFETDFGEFLSACFYWSYGGNAGIRKPMLYSAELLG